MTHPRLLLTILLLALPCAAVLASAAEHVEGTVTLDSSGRPAVRALVVFYQGDTERGRAVTGNDGYYFVKRLPAGTYRVEIVHRKTRKSFDGIVVGPQTRSFDFEI